MSEYFMQISNNALEALPYVIILAFSFVLIFELFSRDRVKIGLIRQICTGTILMGGAAITMDLIKGSIFTLGLCLVVLAIIRLFETK